jgi:hypothetical protein
LDSRTLAEAPARGHNTGVAEHSPNVKRYALVENDGNNGVRRFHLARVASAPALPDPRRLERMEEISARERGNDEAQHESCP